LGGAESAGDRPDALPSGLRFDENTKGPLKREKGLTSNAEGRGREDFGLWKMDSLHKGKRRAQNTHESHRTGERSADSVDGERDGIEDHNRPLEGRKHEAR